MKVEVGDKIVVKGHGARQALAVYGSVIRVHAVGEKGSTLLIPADAIERNDSQPEA